MFESIRLPTAPASRVFLGALAVAAWALLGSVSAGRASAACVGGIEGRGAELQRIAQQTFWTGGYNGAGCPGGGAEATYAQTNSQAGLREWGFLGKGTVETKIAYIGTDAAPTAAQIVEARIAALATGGGFSNVVVVPVTQTAIAVIVNPPNECKLTKITNIHLEEAFSGVAQTWAAIGATPAAKCGGALTRVVRAEGAGTTYQFKNYLGLVNKVKSGGAEAGICAGVATKWSELEGISELGPPNTTWPNCAGAAAPTAVAGDAALAEKVVLTAGSIGYAALPNAKAKGAKVVEVQNNGAGFAAIFASPVFFNALAEEQEEANCANAEYNVPAEGLTTGTGLNVDWSQVFGGNPFIGGTTYPICGLTYDLAWRKYAEAGFGAGVGAQVKGFYEYIVSKGVGVAGKRRYYASLPALVGAGEVHNVQKAAEFAVTKIE
jgi:ABC-type phosphate transport system substrate-binding protein